MYGFVCVPMVLNVFFKWLSSARLEETSPTQLYESGISLERFTECG